MQSNIIKNHRNKLRNDINFLLYLGIVYSDYQTSCVLFEIQARRKKAKRICLQSLKIVLEWKQKAYGLVRKAAPGEPASER